MMDFFMYVFLLCIQEKKALAYDDISYNKVATQSHTYPVGAYYVANNAVDGDIATCMRTYIIGMNDPDKTLWWKVDLGGLRSIFSISILFKNYPGFGCANHGVYGYQCHIPCPTNCNDSICNIEDGTCNTCEAGWTGQFCTKKCAVGRYGVECRGICSGHCKGNTTCNHVTGQCDGGCVVGWKGYLCNKECDDGTYGYDCLHNCSGHCWSNSPCNKQTGHCDGGCEPGYTNVFCSDKCRPGYYGYRCGHLCNGYCMSNGICNHVDGVCLDGCQDGYIGEYCNISCKKGYFGKSCSSVCSPHCKTCRHTDGHCSCSAGYSGYSCTTECFQSYGENCHYPCSQHCYNRNCDRYNGSCLTGCTGGFYGERCNQDIQMLKMDMSSSIGWIVGLSVSLTVNIILITSIGVMCRGKFRKKGSISANLLSCWKISEFYQDTNASIDETSTYLELAVPVSKTELTYHNTTLK